MLLPPTFDDPADYDLIQLGDVLTLHHVASQLRRGSRLQLEHQSAGRTITVRHGFSRRQIEIVEAGGLTNVMKRKLAGNSVSSP